MSCLICSILVLDKKSSAIYLLSVQHARLGAIVPTGQFHYQNHELNAPTVADDPAPNQIEGRTFATNLSLVAVGTI